MVCWFPCLPASQWREKSPFSSETGSCSFKTHWKQFRQCCLMRQVKERTMGWVQRAVTTKIYACHHSQPWIAQALWIQTRVLRPSEVWWVALLLGSGRNGCVCMGIHVRVLKISNPEGELEENGNHGEHREQREERQKLLAKDFSPRKANSIFPETCFLRVVFSGLFWSNS